MYSYALKIKTMASTNILLKLSIIILFCTVNFLSYLQAFTFVTTFTFVTNTSSSNNEVSCIDKERKALLKFKEGVVDPSNFLSSWDGPDCCKWRGVTCNYPAGEVLKLDLSNPNCSWESDNCLGGKLTTTPLYELRYLTHLDLSYNSFSGMIPPNLGNLTNLRVLNLSSNTFARMIPPNLGILSDLAVLRFYPLPKYTWESELNYLRVSDLNWLSGLSSLESLDLSYVDLSLATTHWLQAVNMLPSLSKLYLQSTKLRNIPSSLSHLNLTSLSVLDLSENNFSTQPPQWLFNISGLTVLNLRSCNFNGPISTVVQGSGFCSFQKLDLSENQLKGRIDNLVEGSLLKCGNNSLEELHLYLNQLSGHLPNSLGHLKHLRTLDLHNNLISGQIPKSIGELQRLENLYLCYNQMNGSIPKSLGKLENLEVLHLLENDWEGVISQDNFQGLSKLKVLAISRKNPSFVLNLHSNWVPPFSLNVLYVSNIELGPKFPQWIQTQTQIEGLFLSNVSISEKIPNWLGKISGHIMYLDLSHNQIRGPLPLWPNLSYLDLANNSFSGPIPSNIGQIMSKLEFISLATNSLKGSVPFSFGKMKKLRILDIKNNHLFGEVHDYWTGEYIVGIDLSMNNFPGNIPASLCSLPRLRFLKLSKNMFSGELPSSLNNCKNLRMLDLGGNRFSGRIPEWIGESLSFLQKLSLRGNLFNGRISKKLCHLQELHVLELGQNNLSGPIPPCLGNLSTMKSTSNAKNYGLAEYFAMELFLKGRESVYDYTVLSLVKLIDLSGNILSGYVPEDIINLSGLNSLILSNNHLVGEIPQRIGELQNLETLDLSSNLFSGQIPQSMTSMTFLSHLNLSHNNLSGPIPSSTQFTTFDKLIYEGNPGLCGAPLSNKCRQLVVNEDGDRQHQGQDEVKKEEKEEKLGLYVSITLGFFVGFWSICGSLVIKKSWRDAYYGSLYKMKDYIVMVVAVKVNQFQRMIEKTNN